MPGVPTSYAGAVGTAGAVQYAFGTDGRIASDVAQLKFTDSGSHLSNGLLQVNNITSFTGTSGEVPFLGHNAGASASALDTIAIGNSAGTTAQHIGAVAIGSFAGELGQDSYSVAIGYSAGATTGIFPYTGYANIALGYQSGASQPSSNAIAIGRESGASQTLTDAIAIGYQSGASQTGQYCLAIGTSAGASQSGGGSLAIGISAGATQSGAECIAIGAYSGASQLVSPCIAIGAQAGQHQTGGSIAIGQLAGLNQTAGTIAIGNNTQNTPDVITGINSIAIGLSAGQQQTGEQSLAIGQSAGAIQSGSNCIAIGNVAGASQTENFCIAIGDSAGALQFGVSAIAIGTQAGASQGFIGSANSIAIGTQSGADQQGPSCIAIGALAGGGSQHGNNGIAIGQSAGNTQSGNNCIAIGASAGFNTGGNNTICIGENAGGTSDTAPGGSSIPDNMILIGGDAGSAFTTVGTGMYSIIIGAEALKTQNTIANNCIVLDATGADVIAPTTTGLYVSPIASGVTDDAFVPLYYNDTTKEVRFATGGDTGKVTSKYDFNNTPLTLITSGAETVLALLITTTGITNFSITAIIDYNSTSTIEVNDYLLAQFYVGPSGGTLLAVGTVIHKTMPPNVQYQTQYGQLMLNYSGPLISGNNTIEVRATASNGSRFSVNSTTATTLYNLF